jgi:hypothetical protein
VELSHREKDCNLGHVYCKTKRWFQKSQENFQTNLEKGLKCKGRENGLMQKRFEVEMFFSSLKIFIPLL